MRTVPLGFPEAWPALLALIIVAAGIGGVYAERGRVAVSRVVLAVLGAVGLLGLFLVSWARMPEGIARSILWQAQYVGFYLVPMMCVVVSWWVLRRLASDASTLTPQGRRLVGALVFALCLYVGLYPRVDTMHLIVAMPPALVLAAACAARMGRAWARVFRVAPSTGRGLLAAAAAGLAMVVVLPNFEGVLDASLGPPPQVRYDSPRLPVSVEAARGWDVQAFNAVIGYLRGRLRPGEPVFGFPALPLIPFALGHPTPAPHDYFFPGRPDHRAEVEILRLLEAAPPRFMVTMNRRLGFFSEAPAYYFILRPFLRQEYRLAARFGRYDVFRRRAEPPEPMVEQAFAPTIADADIVASLADPNREVRRVAALRILDLAVTPEQVDAVVARLAPDEASQLLVLRNLGELGDGRALGYAYRTFDRGTGRVKGEAAGVLNFLPLFDWTRPYLIGADRPDVGPGVDVDLSALDLERVRYWAADYKLRRQIGVFAAWALARAHNVAAVPILRNTLDQESKRLFLQVVSAHALVELGHPDAVCALIPLLGYQRHDVQDMVPSFVIGWAQRFPEQLAVCLEQGLRQAHPMAREQSAWVAGATQLQALAPALRGALDDDKPAVRVAAVWALGRLADVAAVQALRRLAADADPAQQTFAAEALRRIGH